MTGDATVVRADARTLPLPDDSVDLIVTSPPYFALRSYSDGGEHYDGQIGDEPSPAEFLEALWACTAEWQRVLKPSGSLFVNLGDKYAERSGPPREGGADDDPNVKRKAYRPARGRRDVRTKSLMGLPWRYALGCIDGEAGELPWILRAELLWQKPNAMPESVTDRVRRTHEQWFHLTKAQRYYAALDEVREPHTGGSNYGRSDGAHPPGGRLERLVDAGERGGVIGSTNPDLFDPRGRMPGSVWSIPSEPLAIPAALLASRNLPDHFAAFPQEWPRRLILGWSPDGICVDCGEGRRPITDTEQIPTREAGSTGRPKRQDINGNGGSGWDGVGYPVTKSSTVIVGYACACTPFTDHPERRRPSVTPGRELRQDQEQREALGESRHHGDAWPARQPVREYHLAGWTPPPTRPAVVLDPFGGTGTVAGVARALGRRGISVDLSHDYCRLARWRILESGHFAKSASRTWGERQGDLFELLDAGDVSRQTSPVAVGEYL